MDITTLEPFFHWLKEHPAWAGFFVFLVAMSESLVIVGLIVPGAVMMFGIGALVGTGVLGLWETLLWAFIGAVIGDGLSFWVGYYFKDRVGGVWPFKSKPEILEKGKAFFSRHGGKSILLGRFVGPVRPVIPAVAGMMHMNPAQFTAINIVSAVGWAPAYLLPGMVFGASVGLASQVATRLAILIVGLVISIWVTVWLIRKTVLFVEPHADEWVRRVLEWSFAHPRIGKFMRSILDPKYTPTSGLAFWGLILLISSWIFFYILLAVSSDSALLRLDLAFYELSQNFRLQTADRLAVFVYELSDPIVVSAVVICLAAWFRVKGHTTAFRYWLLAALSAIGATGVLQFGLEIPRPDTLQGPTFRGGFPDLRMLLATVVTGFFAVLLTTGISMRWRWLVYALLSVAILLIGVSILYLSASWFSDVVGGVALGFVWLIFVGLAFRRHKRVPIKNSAMVAVVLTAFTITAFWNVATYYARDLERFSVQPVPEYIDAEKWWRTEWAQLPMFRTDYKGVLKQPLQMQWLGDAGQIKSELLLRGWQVPERVSIRSLLSYLVQDVQLNELPVLPNVHHGQYEILTLTRPTKNKNERLVFRLWSTNFVSERNGSGIFVASLTVQRFNQQFRLLSIPQTFQAPLEEVEKLASSLQDAKRKSERFALPEEMRYRSSWNGEVILLDLRP